HDLVSHALQRLRKPEAPGLHFLAVREELPVVHPQHLYVPKATAERVPLPRGDRRVKRLHVVAQGQVFDVQRGRERLGRLADGHEDVRLAETGAAIDEERVVCRPRVLGDRPTGRDGEPVRGPDHERLEGVLGVERRGHAVLPAARRFSTISETPFNVSNTPTPCSASALKLATPRKLRASSRSAAEETSSGGRSGWVV